jgi:hypothetical protein
VQVSFIVAGTQLNYIEYKQSIFTKTNLTDKITTYYNNDFEKKLNTYFMAININGLLIGQAGMIRLDKGKPEIREINIKPF